MKLIRRLFSQGTFFVATLLVACGVTSCATTETTEGAVEPEVAVMQETEPHAQEQHAEPANKKAKKERVKKKASTKTKQESKSVDRSDAEYEKLIEMLEHGMMALKEVGAESELKGLDKVAGKLRKERKAATKQRAKDHQAEETESQMGDIAVRLKVLHAAATSLEEAGHEGAAKRLHQAVKTGKLQVSGASQEDILAAYDAGPQPDELIGLLHRGALLNSGNGRYKLSELCLKLANHYSSVRHKMRDGEGSEQSRAKRRREPRTLDLQDRAARVEVLGFARDAHRRARDEHATKQLNEIIHVGELQAKGASQEEIAKAVSGQVNMEMVIGHLKGAAHLYSKWERRDLSKACAALAEFYAKREASRR